MQNLHLLLRSFFFFPYLIQHFPVIRKVFGSLIGARGVALFFWHKCANKWGEFINAALILNAVIRGHFYNNSRWVKYDLFSNLDATQ